MGSRNNLNNIFKAHISRALQATNSTRIVLLIPLLGGMLFSSCTTPTVRVEAPEKPITINLNVKIDHEVRVKVEKDLEDVFAKDSQLF